MSRTRRVNTSQFSYFRNPAHIGHIKNLNRATEEIEEYSGKCKHNRIKNVNRIPINYDDMRFSSMSELYKPYADYSN